MIVLLVAYHVNHLVDGEVLIAELGCAYVLGHVDRCSVTAQQQLVVKAVGGEVGPHRAIVLAEHYTFFQALKHFFLAFKVGVALVIYLVEVHTHAAVGLVEPGIHPGIHHLPDTAHLRVLVFPTHQHAAGLLH